MLTNLLYRQQRLWSVLLTLGMLLQMAIPLLDGTLVYRFSNWLTHESTLEATKIQQLRSQAHSIEELAAAVATITNELPANDGMPDASKPKADFFLQSFLAQTDAQRATKEAAKVPQKPLTLLVSNTNAVLGFSPYATLDKVATKFGSLNALFQLRQQALVSLSSFSFPPVSGQSTLAP